MDIDRDGMGPFMPTTQSPSSSTALNFAYVDNLRAHADNLKAHGDSQFLFLILIRITPPC